MSASVVFQQMIMIFLLIFSGCILNRRGMLPEGTSKGLSALVVNVCNPAILITSGFNRNPSVTNEMVLTAVEAGAVMYVILGLVGILLPRLLGAEKTRLSHYNVLCIFGNVGFLGIPLISAVVGPQALIYVAVINVYFNLLFYTYGIFLVDTGRKGDFQWKKLLNMGTLASVLTIVVFLTQPKLPELIPSTLNYMGQATTMLAMVVVGISLSKMSLKELLKGRRMYVFMGLRFILIPIAISFVFRSFIKDGDLYHTMVLLSAVPAGSISLMAAEELGVDGTVLSRGIILSTLLSVVTIPLVAAFV